MWPERPIFGSVIYARLRDTQGLSFDEEHQDGKNRSTSRLTTRGQVEFRYAVTVAMISARWLNMRLKETEETVRTTSNAIQATPPHAITRAITGATFNTLPSAALLSACLRHTRRFPLKCIGGRPTSRIGTYIAGALEILHSSSLRIRLSKHCVYFCR